MLLRSKYNNIYMTDKHIKVLLVEDDSFISKMYETKLTLKNFEVVTAADGEAGVRLAQTEHPDIILLDIMLPKMDGWQVLEYLKEKDEVKNIPVLLLTNLGAQEDIERGLKLGAADYMIKAHFIPSEVIDKIKQLVSKSKAIN